MKITKSELREIIQEVADEMGLFEGLTKAQEKLPEPLKKAILKKQGKSGDSEEKEDVEEGLTKAQEKLPEPLKKAILKKQGNQEESDEETIDEGNAFGAAVKAARDNGDSEFKVGGKTYQLREKITEEESEEDTEEFTGELDETCEGSCEGCDECNETIDESSCTSEEDEDDVEEGNAFGAAVTKAKEDGDSEFEVDGKTYKVKENWTKITLAEKLDRILGNRKVL